ncbi:MAG: 50S ribosomal protein L29 [Proteobacteria bacterium]|nr:50S ribosomal protein L29 [Pseudomonadota bacterium]MBU4469263.1 50S ribosomal protein L29 [Pseudomonadota bacterium]MCG2752293.1 50S ribosomal protein L29 [Desulfobacteraceae bacterium]
MKTNEIRGFSVEEKAQKVKDLKEELLNLRFQNTIGQLENNRKIEQVKRDIARIKTIIKEAGKE